jgi:DNA-binding transcriptional LysR family regulator
MLRGDLHLDVAKQLVPMHGLLRKFLPSSSITYNDADLVLQAVLDGQGIAQLSGYQIGELLRTGALATDEYGPVAAAHNASGRTMVPVSHQSAHEEGVPTHKRRRAP